MARLRLAVLVLALASTPVLAAAPYAYKMVVTPAEGMIEPAVEARFSRQYRSCQDTAQTTLDMSDCLLDEFTRQDAALNAAWKKAFPRQSKANQPALRAAQRKWAAARDPFCRKHSDVFAGGTLAPIAYSSCRIEVTIRRTMWLEQLAANPR